MVDEGGGTAAGLELSSGEERSGEAACGSGQGSGGADKEAEGGRRLTTEGVFFGLLRGKRSREERLGERTGERRGERTGASRASSSACSGRGQQATKR